MAKSCTNCGNLVLKDDARFCNKCGSILTSSPNGKHEAAQMAQSPEVTQSAKEGETRTRERPPVTGITKRPVLKEQIAFPSRPAIRPFRPAAPEPLRESRVEAWDTLAEPDLAELPTSQLSIVSAPPPIPVQRPVNQRPVTPMLPAAAPRFQPPAPARLPVQPLQPARTAAPVIRQPARRRGSSRLFMIGALLVVLLIGGVVTWLVEFHPFEVPAITQTTAPFQNASLGVSFQYPQGWIAQVDTQHGAASFFDANHTVQFNLNAVAKSGLSVDQYVKNTTGQLGMTGQKSLPPPAFAGQSWSQERGSVLQSGATYTETLLVTMHAGRLYALLLMAPAPICKC